MDAQRDSHRLTVGEWWGARAALGRNTQGGGHSDWVSFPPARPCVRPFSVAHFPVGIDSSSSFALFCVRWSIWGSDRNGSQ